MKVALECVGIVMHYITRTSVTTDFLEYQIGHDTPLRMQRADASFRIDMTPFAEYLASSAGPRVWLPKMTQCPIPLVYSTPPMIKKRIWLA